MSPPSEHPYLDMILANAECVKELEAENERLRTAGDEMAKLIVAELPLSLNEENFKVWFSVVKWQKARRA